MGRGCGAGDPVGLANEDGIAAGGLLVGEGRQQGNQGGQQGQDPGNQLDPSLHGRDSEEIASAAEDPPAGTGRTTAQWAGSSREFRTATIASRAPLGKRGLPRKIGPAVGKIFVAGSFFLLYADESEVPHGEVIMAKVFPAAVLAVLWGTHLHAAEDAKALAKRAGEILQQNCRRCHDGPGSVSGKGFDVRKVKTLLEPNKRGKAILVAGKADASKLWKLVENDSMPEDDPKVPAADKAVLRKWIDAGFVALAEGSELKVIKVEAQVVDVETGTAIRIPLDPVVIDGNKGISEVLQHTGPRPRVEHPAKEREAQNKAIQNNVKNPAVILDGTRISSRQGQHFAIEILKQPLAEFGKKKPQPAEVRNEGGLARATINRDEIYEIRIYNNSGREVAVAVSIDGIDLFHFSRDRVVGEAGKERIVHLKENDTLVGRPRFSHFILTEGEGKPQKELTIPGWHFSQEGDDNFRSFLVTAYGKGAHSKAGIASRAGLGTIQVRFLECYPLDENTRPKAGDETGFGPSRKVNTRIVKYGVGAELDSIAIRYTNCAEGK